MNLFGRIYDTVMGWSKHKFAVFWLSFVSFIEAIFFPIPPDVMLIPMSMSKPQAAMRYAIYTTVASVIGGVIGYGIGYFASDWVQQIIVQWGYQGHFETAMNWFKEWGVWIVFLAGFSPIPFKVFTVCAGILQMAFAPFVATALISRGLRFLLVAKLSAWGGKKYEARIRKSIEIIGWATVALAVVAYLIYKLF